MLILFRKNINTPCLGERTSHKLYAAGKNTSGRIADEAMVAYPVIVYVFQGDECWAVQTIGDEGQALSIPLVEGTYSICAIGGASSTYYVLPTKDDATTTTAITLRDGHAHSDLMAASATAMFIDGGTNTMTLGMERKTMLIQSVTYNRAFTMDNPSTVMLPFSKDVGDISGGTFYTFGGVEKKNNKWVATMKEVTGSLTANTLYLFVPTGTSRTFTGGATLNTTGGGNCLASDAEGWEFHGTYERKLWDEAVTHDYGFAALSGTSVDGQDVEDGQFVSLTFGASAKPMRCYLSYVGVPNQARALPRGAAATDEELQQSIIVRLVGANGQTTGIGTIDTKTGEMTIDNEAWYTLDGVRLSGKPTKKGLYINNGKKVVIKYPPLPRGGGI